MFYHFTLNSRILIRKPYYAQSAEALVPADLEVAHIPHERGGAYPGVFLSTAPARLLRPIAQLPSGARELIGSLEQTYLGIRWGYVVGGLLRVN